MSETTSGRPVTYTRRKALLGAIGMIGAAATAVVINDESEKKRHQKLVTAKIARYTTAIEAEKLLPQQTIQKPPTAIQPTPTIKPVLEAKNSNQDKETLTRIGYFRNGFNPSELTDFCQRIKEQEGVLDQIGVRDEKIKSYNEQFKPLVDKILLMAGGVIGIELAPEFRDLFHCLILAESIGDPNAISSVGATGLTQVMPIGAMDTLLTVGDAWKRKPEAYGKIWDLVKKSNPVTANVNNPKELDLTKIKVDDFKKQNLIDPATNIALGAVQFLTLINRFDENLGMTISAYNAGSGKIKDAVNKYWQMKGEPAVRYSNRPNFIEAFNLKGELGLDPDEKNENWIYLPRILAIYRKIHGPQVFPLVT